MIKHSPDAWNLRAGHMFRTLKRILEHRGDGAKAIIWTHNSHAGDAKATTISKGDVSLGRLCREKIGDDKVALLGCGTYEGTFIAAREWGGDAEIMPLPPPPPPLTAIEMELDIGPSYEALFHATRIPSWFLDLRHGKCEQKLREELLKTRKERAVGVIYDPESEPESVWQDAILPDEFDGWVWFDSTTPLKVLEIKQPKTAAQLADTWPWGL
jgi:erythromycin esterase-like protein